MGAFGIIVGFLAFFFIGMFITDAADEPISFFVGIILFGLALFLFISDHRVEMEVTEYEPYQSSRLELNGNILEFDQPLEIKRVEKKYPYSVFQDDTNIYYIETIKD